MPVCTSGHDQPEFAKFCGICGSVINPLLEGVLPSSASSPGITDEVTPIELDLMSDDNELEGIDEDEAVNDDEDSEDELNLDEDDDEAVDDEDEAVDDEDEDSNALNAQRTFGTTVNPNAMKMLMDWAEEIDELDDPYVRGLTNAVARRDDLSVWASLDPLELLPNDQSNNWKRISQASNVISALRNILVFLPVLLTWLAIGKALDAFGEFTKLYANQNPGESRDFSFIGFWQNPNEFATKYLTTTSAAKELLSTNWWIGHVARLDALIILVIIFLTFVSGVLTWFAENRETIAIEIADRARVEVGLAIAVSLHGKRQANPESISEALAEALNDLTQAARDVNETASRLEQASIGVESLAPKIEILNTHTEQLVAQTATSVSKAVNDLVTSVQNLNTSVGGNITELFSEAANTLEEVSKQLARTSNSAEYGIKQLRDDLEAIHKQLQSLTKGGRP